MVDLFLDAQATLGESPRWNEDDGCLYWVDIEAQRLHRTDGDSGSDAFIQLGQQIGCVLLCRTGGFLLAMEDGLYHMREWGAELRPFGDPVLADKPNHRFNDGCVDPQGRLWVGTVTRDKSNPDACLYRVDPDGSIHEMLGGLLTSNGAAFSPDGGIFYHADTPTHAIRHFEFDAEKGLISDPAVLHQFPFGEGRPDGCAVDEDGYYWSALFDGGRVVRLSPTGQIVQSVAIPASRVTMIALGGHDRKTAYVTTANKGLSAQLRTDQPHAGGIFSFRAEVAGLRQSRFDL